MRENKQIRLLVIDDSAYNRRTIAGFFAEYPNVEVIGKAMDGQEGLQLALNERPNVITLDLEMPRLDGFSFLRLLMSSQPIPVIVISSHADKENIFRALELGALDFVAKPSHRITPELNDIKENVVRKVLAAGNYNLDALQNLSSTAPQTGLHYIPQVNEATGQSLERKPRMAQKVVAIAASTGGPASLSQVIRGLPADLDAGIVIVQHMPPKFTTTFAERLNKLSSLTVVELTGREYIQTGHVYVAPGDKDLEVSKSGKGFIVQAMAPDTSNRYNPCADRLFSSAGRAVGSQLLAVVLTGMGDDGTAGASVVTNNGGTMLVESEETAIVNGMPLSVIESGVPTMVRPLHFIARQIVKFVMG